MFEHARFLFSKSGFFFLPVPEVSLPLCRSIISSVYSLYMSQTSICLLLSVFIRTHVFTRITGYTQGDSCQAIDSINFFQNEKNRSNERYILCFSLSIQRFFFFVSLWRKFHRILQEFYNVRIALSGRFIEQSV